MYKKRVDDIAATNESYIDEKGNTVYLKDKGKELSIEQSTLLKGILIGLEDTSKFRYFTIEELENDLDLLHMEYNLLTN